MYTHLFMMKHIPVLEISCSFFTIPQRYSRKLGYNMYAIFDLFFMQ